MKSIIILTVFCFQIGNSFSQWTPIPPPNVCQCFTLGSSGQYILAGTGQPGEPILYYSLNNGQNWIPTSANKTVYDIINLNQYVFFGCADYGVYKSSDNGLNWTQTMLNNTTVNSIAVSGNYILASSYGVYVSSDNGQTWIKTLNNSTSNAYSLAANGSTVFAGSSFIGGLVKSTNNGLNWSNILLDSAISALAICGNYVLAGIKTRVGFPIGGYGVFRSSNGGLNWSQTSINALAPWDFFVKDSSIFVTARGGIISCAIYYSYNYGVNWIDITGGLNMAGGYTIWATSDYVFVGGAPNNGTIWRRPLSEITGINNSSNSINSFSLSQNYPNPFNPSTTIKFDIPKSSHVQIVMYDLLGREVDELLNEERKPGSYEVTWDGSRFASGVYFYKVIANDFVETKKMILIK